MLHAASAAWHDGKGGRRVFAFRRKMSAVVFFAALCISSGCLPRPAGEDALMLRITDWKSGELLAQAPARVGSRLFFGWEHSQEKIPWNEYYHVDAANNLVLDAITFPAFGAGIPENKGAVCYVRNGLIHMEGIGQVFPELVWLNSHTATREITLDGAHVRRGDELPQHTRLRLVIERR